MNKITSFTQQISDSISQFDAKTALKTAGKILSKPISIIGKLSQLAPMASKVTQFMGKMTTSTPQSTEESQHSVSSEPSPPQQHTASTDIPHPQTANKAERKVLGQLNELNIKYDLRLNDAEVSQIARDVIESRDTDKTAYYSKGEKDPKTKQTPRQYSILVMNGEAYIRYSKLGRGSFKKASHLVPLINSAGKQLVVLTQVKSRQEVTDTKKKAREQEFKQDYHNEVEVYQKQGRTVHSNTLKNHSWSYQKGGDTKVKLAITAPKADSDFNQYLVKGAGRIPIQQTNRHIRSITDQMTAMHQQGIIHRDLKSENVLVHSEGARVADFGMTVIMPPSVQFLREKYNDNQSSPSDLRKKYMQDFKKTVGYAGTRSFSPPEVLNAMTLTPELAEKKRKEAIGVFANVMSSSDSKLKGYVRENIEYAAITYLSHRLPRDKLEQYNNGNTEPLRNWISENKTDLAHVGIQDLGTDAKNELIDDLAHIEFGKQQDAWGMATILHQAYYYGNPNDLSKEPFVRITQDPQTGIYYAQEPLEVLSSSPPTPGQEALDLLMAAMFNPDPLKRPPLSEVKERVDEALGMLDDEANKGYQHLW